MEIAASGELYAHEGSYATALEKYQLALGKLLELVQSEPKGRRRDLLVEEVNRWMTQAEYLKELANGGGGGVSPKHDTGTETIPEGDIEKNCSIQ